MSKFKKGDEVVRTKGYFGGMKKGDTGTVKRIKNKSVFLEEYARGHSIDSLELVNKDEWQEGRFIKKNGSKRKILGRLNDIVFVSQADRYDRMSSGVSDTKQYFKSKGYELVPKEDDIVEMSVRAIAEKLDIEPSKLKIIDK